MSLTLTGVMGSTVTLTGVMDATVSLTGVMDSTVDLAGVIDGFVILEYGEYSLDFSKAKNSFYLGVI